MSYWMVEIAILTYIGACITMPFLLAMASQGLMMDESIYFRMGRNPGEKGIVALCRISALIIFAPFVMLTVLTAYLLNRLPNALSWLFTERE